VPSKNGTTPIGEPPTPLALLTVAVNVTVCHSRRCSVVLVWCGETLSRETTPPSPAESPDPAAVALRLLSVVTTRRRPAQLTGGLVDNCVTPW
jgi:hypothetical protein